MAIAPSANRNSNGVATWSVLTRNSGSSSLKFGFYKADASRIETRLRGEGEGLGQATADTVRLMTSAQRTPTND